MRSTTYIAHHHHRFRCDDDEVIYVWHTKISVNKTPPTQIEVIDLRRSTTYGDRRRFSENLRDARIEITAGSKLKRFRSRYLDTSTSNTKKLSDAKVQILSKCETHSPPSLLVLYNLCAHLLPC